MNNHHLPYDQEEHRPPPADVIFRPCLLIGGIDLSKVMPFMASLTAREKGIYMTVDCMDRADTDPETTVTTLQVLGVQTNELSNVLKARTRFVSTTYWESPYPLVLRYDVDFT